MAEELIKKTATMLRAVLISSPRGVPLYRLDREYRSITFEPIPYSKCGFNNLEDFLRNIPKVARIQKDRDGETVVIGVPSEADQHVAKLIAKQKKPKIKKSTSRPARRPTVSPYRSTPAKINTSRFGPRSVKIEQTVAPKLPSSSFGQSVPYRASSQTPRFVPPRLRKILQPQADNKQASSTTKRVVTFGLPDDKSKLPMKTSKKPAKTSNKVDFTNMQISLASDPPADPISPVVKPTTVMSSTLSPEVLERIGEIAGKNSNGFFLKRLPVLYKEKYHVDLPENIEELLLSYPHILHIENSCDHYIAYPPKVNQTQTPQTKVEGTKPIEPKRKVMELYTVKPYTVPAIGSSVQVYVSHVENPSEFYVQYKESEEKLKALLEKLDADFKNTTEYISDPKKGMCCGAQFSMDGSWYRARIQECIQEKDTHTVNVLYVDFGNSEMLPHTRLRYLQKEHVEVPQIAVHCGLHGIGRDDKETKERLLNMVDQVSSMTLVERVGDVLMVGLTDEQGNDIASRRATVSTGNATDKDDTRSSTPEPEQKKPLKPFLKMKSVSIEQDKKIPGNVVIPDEVFIDITVSTVFSTDNISVMLYGEQYSDKLLALEISMMSYFAESSQVAESTATPHAGDVWAIKSSELHPEEQYYRVKVVNISNQQAQLEFVDYGDTKHAPVSALKSLPARFLELPFQAFSISLHEIPRSKKPNVLDKLKHHILGKSLVAEVIKRTQNKLEVEIYDTSSEQDININEVMRSLIIPDEDLVPALPKVGHQVEARLSHITDTGSVFVQIPGAGLNRLEELMTDITEHYSKSSKAAEFVSHPSVGHIYCAKCADCSWYRAIILEELPDRKVRVQCVDYGNTEVLIRTALREPTAANEHLNLLPFQAIECQLDGLSKESWTAEKTARMNELVSEDVILQVTRQEEVPIVKLYLTTEDDQQINILELILDEVSSPRSAVSESDTTDQNDKESSSQEEDQEDTSPCLPPAITLSRPWVDVTLSDVIDPGHFMFQPLEYLQRLEELNEQMTEQYNKKLESDYLVSPRIGDLCAVRYKNNQFYRAVVKALLSPQQICVLFIDYGDLGIYPPSDFRILADSFKQIPSIAVKGCLAGIRPLLDSGEWSDGAKKRFEELTLWKMLVGSVEGDLYSYDFREEHKISINLYDTSDNTKDIRIAELLVNEGLARCT